MALPVIEREDSDWVGVFEGFVTRQKKPAYRRLYTERLKVVAADQLNRDLLGVIVPGDAGGGRRDRNEPAQDSVVVSQIPIHGIRKIMVVVRAVAAFRGFMSFSAAGVAQDDQLVWILHRQSTQQCLVEQGEDSGVG